MTSPYLTVLRIPGTRSRLLSVVLSAVPLGAMSLTVLLCVRQWTASPSSAGIAAGLFTAGNAVGIAVQGRWMDRHGPPLVITGSALSFGAAVTGLVVAGRTGAPTLVLWAAAAAAGASVPAVTTAVRAWLPRAVDTPDQRSAAYALLALVFQGAMALGPMLVSAALLLHGPALAAGAAGVLVLGAAALYPRSTSTGRPVPTPARSSARPGKRARVRDLRGVLVPGALTGAGYGSLLVGVPAVATDAGAPALAGVLLTGVALGEAAGALAYGARAWPGGRRRHLLVTLVVSAAACASGALLAPTTLLLAVALLVHGAAAGPTAVALSAALDDADTPATTAGAYSLLVTATLVGTAAGTAATGTLVDLVAAPTLLLVPALLSLAAAGYVGVHAARSGEGPRGRRSTHPDDDGGRAAPDR